MPGHAIPLPHVSPFAIRVDDLRGAAVHALLQEHLDSMARHSPTESVHALDVERLRHPDITFWTAWTADTLVGCGALRAIESDTGEIKSMRTATPFLRRGVARAMLGHIVAEAQKRKYRRLYLETGSMAAFLPARTMYAACGFVACEPFGDYVPDRNSAFMTKML